MVFKFPYLSNGFQKTKDVSFYSSDSSVSLFKADLFADSLGEPAPGGRAGSFAASWDENGICVNVDVKDRFSFENSSSDTLWLGDSIEFFFSDLDAVNMVQVIAAPGMDPDYPRVRVKMYDYRKDALKQKCPIKETVPVRRDVTSDGYRLSVFFPLHLLNIFPDKEKTTAGLRMQLYINDKPESDKPLRNYRWYYRGSTHLDFSSSYPVELVRKAERMSPSVVYPQITGAVYDEKIIRLKLYTRKGFSDMVKVSGKVQNGRTYSVMERFRESAEFSSAELDFPFFYKEQYHSPLEVSVGNAFSGFIDISRLPIVMTENDQPFGEEMIRYERADKLAMPEPGAVLFYGSSTIRLWDTLGEDMKPLRVINRGFGGSVCAQAVDYFDRLVRPYRPRAVVLYEGDNDIGAGIPIDKIQSDFITFAGLMRESFPEASLYLLTPKVSPSRLEFQKRYQQLYDFLKNLSEKNDHIYYVNINEPLLDKDGRIRPELFMEDKIHLNRRGYDVLTEIIKPVLLSNETDK